MNKFRVRAPPALVGHPWDAIERVDERFRAHEQTGIPLDAVLGESTHRTQEVKPTHSNLVFRVLPVADEAPIVDIEPVEGRSRDGQPLIVNPAGRYGSRQRQQCASEHRRRSGNEVAAKESLETSALAFVVERVDADSERLEERTDRLTPLIDEFGIVMEHQHLRLRRETREQYLHARRNPQVVLVGERDHVGCRSSEQILEIADHTQGAVPPDHDDSSTEGMGRGDDLDELNRAIR